MIPRFARNTIWAIIGLTLGMVLAAQAQSKPGMARISSTTTQIRMRVRWTAITYQVPIAYVVTWTRNNQVMARDTTARLADTVAFARAGQGIPDSISVRVGALYQGTVYGEVSSSYIYSNGTAPAPVPPPPPAPPPPPPPPPPAPLKAVIDPKPPVCVGLTCWLDGTKSTGAIVRREWFEICPLCNRAAVQDTNPIWTYLTPSTNNRWRGLRIFDANGAVSLDSVFFASSAPVDTTTPVPPPPPPPGTPPPVAGMPELPRVYLNTAYVAPTGPIRRVPAGGDLQAALNAAACGERILLAPGAVYTAAFKLPKNCTAVTEVSTETTLPPEGTRVTPTTGASFARLRTPGGNQPVLMANVGAGGYRIMGVIIEAPTSVTALGALVEFHTAPLTAVSQLAHDIILDRVVIQGHDQLQLRRCALLNAVRVAVVDSWLAGCHAKGSDSQAILFWDTPGPVKIVNNMLEGAGENLMIGGSDPQLSGVVPSDIEIRRNHIYKPLAWKASNAWTVKNSLELKIGKRILIEGNVLENAWPDGQVGFAVVIKSVNQANSAPWSETAHVTMQWNLIKNTAHGIDISGHPEPYPVIWGNNIAAVQNLLIGLNGPGGARGFMLDGATAGTTIRNNTVLGSTGHGLLLHGPKQTGTLTMENNLVETWIKSADGFDYGVQGLNGHLAAWAVSGNLFVIAYDNVIALHPPGNRFAPSLGGVGFVSFPGDVRLSASSPFRGTGTDGKDPGVDFATLMQKIAGVAP